MSKCLMVLVCFSAHFFCLVESHLKCRQSSVLHYTENTMFVSPDTDVCIEQTDTLVLQSGVGVLDDNADKLCVNITEHAQETEVIECVSDRHRDVGYSRSELKHFNGAWVLKILSPYPKINQSTYSWWFKTRTPRKIAETTVFIYDGSTFPWYVETQSGRRLSVGCHMSERNAIDVGLTDNRGNLVFDLVNVDGEAYSCNKHVKNDIDVSIHNNIFVMDIENVSCENEGFYELTTTTEISFNVRNMYLHVKENITVNIFPVKLPKSYDDFAVLRCAASTGHHSEPRRIRWFHDTNEILMNYSKIELNITNFQFDDVGTYSCQIQTSCRTYSSQKIGVYLESNISHLTDVVCTEMNTWKYIAFASLSITAVLSILVILIAYCFRTKRRSEQSANV
ncbi:uncharacterized protein [Ptychodera flava]|uniref:uncharacterized protein n=1 Tax=Ptychodera flava TaxID=63121 RepID=UPI00396A5F9E